VPIFNSEIYIVRLRSVGFTEEVTTAVGCAVGQTIGKVGTVLALRGAAGPVWCDGYESDASAPASRPVAFGPDSGPGRTGCWDSWVNAGWGVPIVFLSACLAIPPLYAVTLAVPATKMSVIPFGVAVLIGRMLLYLAIAFGVSSLID
jgi:hypothetical protein